MFPLTFPKHEEPGDGVGEDPGVSTELEQVIRENIDPSKTQPVEEKKNQIII